MFKQLVPILGLLTSVAAMPAALAHGVAVDYRVTSANVEIEATYDSGKPLANAQVVIYAPDAPTQAWLTGTADAEGRFSFTPPANQMGNWQVKVRQAGHGAVLNVPVASNSQDAGLQVAQDSGLHESHAVNPVQRGLMSFAVIGGFVLTAVIFSSKKR